MARNIGKSSKHSQIKKIMKPFFDVEKSATIFNKILSLIMLFLQNSHFSTGVAPNNFTDIYTGSLLFVDSRKCLQTVAA